jgi:putative intracellular protease/amidase
LQIKDFKEKRIKHSALVNIQINFTIVNSLRSLIICTSNNKLPNSTKETGVWLESLAAPYYILKDGGEYITIVSPHGGRIPVDPNSRFTIESSENSIRFQQDAQAMYHLSHSLPLNEVNVENYDLVFVTGGYGAMGDLANNKELKQILEDFSRQNKPIGLVGHGVVALISLTMNNGEPFVKGRKLTAFSNNEEELIGLNEKPPYLLESRLKSLGALYSKGPDFSSYIVANGNIITGQNPASSGETARQLLSLAHKNTKFRKLKINQNPIQKNILDDKKIY